ncbi:MAG: dTDP-4-dehydrorhamnose 3,5-epimerase [Synechococcaceae cyanobacterium]|nr:dTDP-4-dehydrorhamnose 3,5-epimerase [Synechococcaceae cyanobacterium]
MTFTPLGIPGVWLVEPDFRVDSRGFFGRLFCAETFAARGLPSVWPQMNNALTRQKHTLRGLHIQVAPHGEDKLVRCVRGALWDVVVDLRRESPSYGQWQAAELSAENRRMMLLPKGVAHGFITLEPDTEAVYLVSAPYAPEAERTLLWSDPTVAIPWPATPALVSDKDLAGQRLEQIGSCGY